ncbi:unnamed protein product [Bursaphelenchus xylophilus]|uniref:(pine wood nematode) hypothetical protein n=1 Tax=Bursaphelenchus xylophilus TaxID=6326 RepID=A0A1I7SF37_BURXY|nr:unnamed protein product [Bursaphelenchus xylophilus]CAG9078878.1 unnamed protein product [Bursaphelenchus xylophilus]
MILLWLVVLGSAIRVSLPCTSTTTVQDPLVCPYTCNTYDLGSTDFQTTVTTDFETQCPVWSVYCFNNYFINGEEVNRIANLMCGPNGFTYNGAAIDTITCNQ